MHQGLAACPRRQLWAALNALLTQVSMPGELKKGPRESFNLLQPSPTICFALIADVTAPQVVQMDGAYLNRSSPESGGKPQRLAMTPWLVSILCMGPTWFLTHSLTKPQVRCMSPGIATCKSEHLSLK